MIMLEEIRIKKAAQHNLKHIDVTLPRNKLIVVTGPSGSGKSSLAFDTIFAEGQRRYIECLSAYARQFIDQMEKPEVEAVEGISPAISIDQKTISANPRSTVGTVTEVMDFLRLLFAKAGTPHCPGCGREIVSLTNEEIAARAAAAFAGARVRVLAPVVRGRKGEFQRLFDRVRKKGYIKVRVNGSFRELDDDIRLDRLRKHSIEVLVDTVRVSETSGPRLREAVDRALELAGGEVLFLDERGGERFFSRALVCPECGVSLSEIEPRNFSFNSPYGACPECNGLGRRSVDNELGGLDLTEEVCPACRGARLKKESLAVTVGGRNIHQIGELALKDLRREVAGLAFPEQVRPVAEKIIKEITARLAVIDELGLSYLHLNRTAASLSGGEAQRVRLAAQVSSRLRGVLYVLDEPTIGLHQRDGRRLISLLRSLRDRGNSIIVVEHDEQTIRAADHILDLGPGAGEQGGSKVAEGPLEEILRSPDSLTAMYLRREKVIPVPTARRRPSGWLTISGAREHNLKDIDVRVPLSVMTAVTGVSGSGKSSLVIDILYRALARKLYRAQERVGDHDRITGLDRIDKAVVVDQKPIGRTPRSNPATYTGLFSALRELMSRTPEARLRGYRPGRFSFNVPGGRCDECEGAGVKKVEMHFLPDVFVTCDRCRGRRYNKETLSVTYKGRSVADYLDMTVDDAYELLKAHPVLKRKLMTLKRVGLGYIRLGQKATELSGGEAQRIKLTKELGRRGTGSTLYILDEPTTGLHFEDVRKLLEVLDELTARGNTVIIIEHNLEVVRYCDYIIDLGPEGGAEGGYVVALGTPEEVTAAGDSHTGECLRRALQTGAAPADGPAAAGE